MTFDPFADPAESGTTTTEAAPGPWDDTSAAPDIPAPRSGDSHPLPGQHDSGAHKVRVTLKAGPGYEAPWITVDGTDVADAADQLSDGSAVDKLVKVTVNAAKHFHGTYGTGRPASSGGGQARQAGKPEAADQAPDGEERYCKHGRRKYMSGISKTSGKAYKGFFCNETDRSEQCKPEFVK